MRNYADSDGYMTSAPWNQAYQVAGDDVLPVRYEDSWDKMWIHCNKEEAYPLVI